MTHPQLVVFAPDDWLSKQLAELAADARWVAREARQPAAALAHLGGRPTVLVVQFDPHNPAAAVGLVADAVRRFPDVAVVAVSDVKLSDDPRAAWTAALLDLGVRYVLFPPLSRPVLEDVASGLMAAAVRRSGPAAEPVIDLAAEGLIDV